MKLHVTYAFVSAPSGIELRNAVVDSVPQSIICNTSKGTASVVRQPITEAVLDSLREMLAEKSGKKPQELIMFSWQELSDE
jgi:hypothetical protein